MCRILYSNVPAAGKRTAIWLSPVASLGLSGFAPTNSIRKLVKILELFVHIRVPPGSTPTGGISSGSAETFLGANNTGLLIASSLSSNGFGLNLPQQNALAGKT
jgi:hypothetical protein